MSEHALFDVINIEEELHFAFRLTELRDVSLEVLLHAFRQIAESQPDHFVVPLDDRFGIFLCRVIAHPLIDLVIARAGCDKLFELGRIESSEFPEVGAKPARIEVVLAIDPQQISILRPRFACPDEPTLLPEQGS